jgi:hypothetical protein
VLIYNRKARRTEIHAAGTVTIYDTSGTLHTEVPFDHKEIRTISAYYNAMKSALNGRPGGLARFAGITVTDVYGHSYSLLTDPDAFRFVAGTIEPDDYFKSGDFIVSAAAEAA